MNSPFRRILHLEDNATDAELIQATLEVEGVQVEVTRVEAKEDFVGALKQGRFDLILADYTLPSFDGLSALRIAQQYARDVPFVFVSGTLGEDIAIEALKTGATDYVLKTRMARLGPAVKRALGEAREKAARRCAEEALRDSEEQWKAAFECNPVMYFMVDGAGTTLSVNNCGADQLGYERSELIGQPIRNILHEDDREFVQNNAKNCFQNLGRTMRWEARKIRKDGTVIWVRETANALLLKNKSVLLVVCEDITERKRAEEAVRRSEKQLRDLVETMPAMAIIMRPDGTNEFVSQRWIEFSGLSPEQTAGSGWEVTLHPDDAEAHHTKWRASWSTGQPFENEARHRDAHGNYRWLLVRVVPLRDEQGNILKWYGALTDIEDRKRAEALLAGEKRILEMLAKGDSLSQILDSLCRLVEEQAPGVLASILLVDGNRLWHGGAPSLPKAYTDAINGVLVGPSVGSCGTAAFTTKQVIVTDIATDPRWADFREAALPHSLRACWSTPISSAQGKVIATFAMYYREQRSPTLQDQEIVEQITRLAGNAIERKLIADKLSQSERILAEAQRLSHTGSFVWDITTKEAVYLADEWYRIYGYDPETDEHAWDERLQRVHPDDLSKWQAAVDRAISEKSDYELEYRLVLPTGITKYVHVLGCPVLNSAADVVQFIGNVTDITERKRAEALLKGERRLLEMIATGVPLKEILNALCATIEEQRPGTLASVLLMNPDGVHLDVIAGPTLPNEWTRQMEKLPIGPCAGSCGTAAYRGTPVIVADITTDPLWNVPEHRASALNHNLRASWSSPVLSSKGKVLGTFCMYYGEPRSPSGPDLELIELTTHLARVAIERDHAEEALRASEQLARSHVEVMMRSLDVLATGAAPEKFIGEMLRTIGQHLHACRVTFWLRNQKDDLLRLRVAIEDEQQIAPDPDHPLVKDPHMWKKNLFIEEMFFTRSPVVCDDIEHDSRIDTEFREYLASRACKKFLAIPTFVSGGVRGFIGIHHTEQGAYRAEEIELAQALAHHVMIAVHEQELAEQHRQAAILNERTRMARDIHDTLAQGFTGVIVQLDAAVEALRDEEPEGAAKHIRRARELARASLSEARRSVHALRPQVLEKAAFAEALKAIIENTTAGTSLRTDFQIRGEPRELEPTVEENLFHIGQEALTNALKHARATKFQARLSFASDVVRLELRDNGDGFVVESKNGGGFGLIGMKERAEQMRATLKISSKPGAGTKIVAVSPYHHPFG
jgi:PAS domain S-box-containing protein